MQSPAIRPVASRTAQMGNDQGGGGAGGSSREARGADLEWDQGEIDIIAPGSHNYYVVTSIDDTGGAAGMSFDDGLANSNSVVNEAGVVYIHNALGSPILVNHDAMAPTATALPFFLTGRQPITLLDDEIMGFVRNDNEGAWMQMWPSRSEPASVHITSLDSPYSVPAGIGYVYAHLDLAVVSVVLPAASAWPSRLINVKIVEVGESGQVDITAAGGDVDGIATFTINDLNESVYLASDGVDWWIISYYLPAA